MLKILKQANIELIALRSAGFNHVDLKAAESFNLPIVRVPSYSPFSVAEHAVCLLLSLNRKIHKAFMRVQSINFSLDGLVEFDLFGKTIGIIGTGNIGEKFIQIMNGFKCKVLAYDINPRKELENICDYVKLEKLYEESDIISLHIPLTPKTFHLLNKNSISSIKKGVYIINTSRGAFVDSKALIDALKSGQVEAAELDVYEEEETIFFQDQSDQVLQDDILARLITFPNVLITSHQAFLTKEALSQIANITIDNIKNYLRDGVLKNTISTDYLS